MLNQIVLVGRLLSFTKYGITIKMTCPDEDNTNVDIIVPIHLKGSIMENTKDYCKKNDLVGIKGSFSVNSKGKTIVVANKITFLSSSKGGD